MTAPATPRPRTGRRRGPCTVVGYVVTWVVSWLLTGLTMALVFGGDGGGNAVVSFTLMAWAVSAVCSLPGLLIGLPLVHLACRHVGPQSVHVLAVALAGAITGGGVAMVVSGEWQAAAFGLIPAVAAGIGRIVAIAYVPVVRPETAES